jgi:hypothetical protein
MAGQRGPLSSSAMPSQRRRAWTGQVSWWRPWDADGPALALLVGLAGADEDVDALVDEVEILDIEGGELAAPEATGDAEQEDRPVADGEEVVLGGGAWRGSVPRWGHTMLSETRDIARLEELQQLLIAV